MRHIIVPSQGKWYWRVDYLGWSLACAIAWAVIWILVGTLASANSVHTLGYVFLGWVIGSGMSTLARVVYPAPRSTLLTRQTTLSMVDRTAMWTAVPRREERLAALGP